MPQTGERGFRLLIITSPCSFSSLTPSRCLLQVVDFFNGNLKRRRQKRKEAQAMMKLKRLSSIHTEANGAVIGRPLGTGGTRGDQEELV